MAEEERKEVVSSGKEEMAGGGSVFRPFRDCGTGEGADAVPRRLQNCHHPSPMDLTSTGTMGNHTKTPLFLPKVSHLGQPPRHCWLLEIVSGVSTHRGQNPARISALLHCSSGVDIKSALSDRFPWEQPAEVLMWRAGVKAAAKDPSVQGGGSNRQRRGGGNGQCFQGQMFQSRFDFDLILNNCECEGAVAEHPSPGVLVELPPPQILVDALGGDGEGPSFLKDLQTQIPFWILGP